MTALLVVMGSMVIGQIVLAAIAASITRRWICGGIVDCLSDGLSDGLSGRGSISGSDGGRSNTGRSYSSQCAGGTADAWPRLQMSNATISVSARP
jgi:hypothetical protein